jgi:Tfp pilus assembly protein PilE
MKSSNMHITKGATFLELLVADAVVAILSLISYTTFDRIKTESRRSDAHASILSADSNINNYMAQNNQATFGSSDLATTQFANYAPSASTPVFSNSGYYMITIVLGPTTNCDGIYCVNAAALDSSSIPCNSGGSATSLQCTDTQCSVIYLDQGDTDGRKSIDSSGVVADATTTKCW